MNRRHGRMGVWLGRGCAKLREYFLLEQAANAQDQIPWAVNMQVVRARESAQWRIAAARHLRERCHPRAALLLWSAGLGYLANAYCLAQGIASSASGDPKTSLGELLAGLAQRSSPLPARLRADLDAVRDGLTLSLDDLAVDEMEALLGRFDRPTQWLTEAVGMWSAPRLRAVRRSRWLALVLFLVTALTLLLVWLLTPENIALNKRVVASPAILDTRAERVVDGKRFGVIAYHSDLAPSPWLRIDLGKRYPIGRVEIYGRHDCCHEQSVPMAVEVSDDGKHFRGVAVRHEPLHRLNPWTVTLDYISARYVRVHTLRSTNLVLSEVEVYAK